jgi:hypothetical protein
MEGITSINIAFKSKEPKITVVIGKENIRNAIERDW